VTRIPLTLLAAAAIATAVCLCDTPRAGRPYALEADVAATRFGTVRASFDTGRGFNDADAASVAIYPLGRMQPVRLPLPPGDLRAIRLDPTDSGAEVRLAHVRVAAPGGWAAAEIGPGAFTCEGPAASSVDGPVLTVRPAPGETSARLLASFGQPVHLRYGPLERFAGAWRGVLAGTLGLLVAAGLAELGWERRARWLPLALAHPKASVALVALGASAAATYPVVFCARSFVSPNVGAALLRESPPTVPGPTGTWTENPRTDIGAMMWQFLPYSAVQGRAILRDRELPLWNRFNSAGVTLLGQGQSMLPDPLHVMVALAGGASWAWDLKFVLARAFFAAGLGLCVLQAARSLGPSALIAAAAPFFAFFNFRYNHGATFSVCYSPWILLAWLRLCGVADRRRAAAALLLLAGANVLEVVGGTVKESYMAIAVLNATGALAWVLAPLPGWRARLRVAVRILAVAALAVTVAAPVWLTFMDALRGARTSYDAPFVAQVPRAWLIGFFDDIFYRELSDARRYYVPAANGLILLGVLAAVVHPRSLLRQPAACACAAGLAASLAVAFQFTPPSWILAVPFLRNVCYEHSVFSGVALVPAAVLAGWGLDRALRRGPRRWALGRALGALAIVGLLARAYFADTAAQWRAGPGLAGLWARAQDHAFFYVVLALSLGALASLAWLAVRGSELRRAPTLLAFALCVLFFRHGLHLPYRTLETYLAMPGRRGDLAAPSPPVATLQALQGEPARVAGLGNDFLAGFSGVYGLEGYNGPDAIMNRPYRQLADEAGMVDPGDWHFTLGLGTLAARKRVLDFLNVRYLLADPGSQVPRGLGYRRVGSWDLDLYESPSAWPRAFFTDRVSLYRTPRELLQQVDRGDGRPFASVDADDWTPTGELGRSQEGRTLAPARDYLLTANTTAFSVDAPGPGIAVLGEAWLDGDFRATLDGAPAPYFRVNHAFKAVLIPEAGRHRLVFAYWPRHLTAALALSALASLALAGFLAFERFRSREGLVPPGAAAPR